MISRENNSRSWDYVNNMQHGFFEPNSAATCESSAISGEGRLDWSGYSTSASEAVSFLLQANLVLMLFTTLEESFHLSNLDI